MKRTFSGETENYSRHERNFIVQRAKRIQEEREKEKDGIQKTRFINRYTGKPVTSYTPEEDRRFSLEQRKERSKTAMNVQKDARRSTPKTEEGKKLRYSNLKKSLKTKSTKRARGARSRKRSQKVTRNKMAELRN